MKAFLKLVVLTALTAATVFSQKELAIAQIQGNKNLSEYVGQSVRTTGIVTARVRTGFFLQTSDAKADSDSLSSEGIYVFTKDEPPPEVAVGGEITITGKVEEFRHRNENYGLTITEINHFLGRDSIRVLSHNNPLPKPITLTHLDFKANAIDQLEKFEGMRVHCGRVDFRRPYWRTGGPEDRERNFRRGLLRSV